MGVSGSSVAYLMSWYKIPSEKQDGHDNMLSHWDDIGTRYLEWIVEMRTRHKSNVQLYLQDLYTAFNSSIQVNVIGSDTGSNANFEVLRLQG